MPVSKFPSIDGNKLVISPTLESPKDDCVAKEARARLDDEIAALTFKLCTLRSRRNSLSPVSRLPTEILASIFIHCARTYQQPRHVASDIPTWVSVSYVCRHWRDIAVNTPVLWSFLFVSSQEWTDELLARSKTAPLKVCVDAEYPGQTNELYLLKKVAPLTDRVQDLTLWLTRREAERILSLFSSRAPLLQCLRISVERSNHLGDSALKLTNTLFDGYTPALRDLQLTNYIFPLKTLPLGGLTSLRLRDLGSSFQPTLAELGVILGRMPGLEHLHLENALPGARVNSDGQPSSSPGELCFPRLSRFSLVAPFSTVVLLLSLFRLPIKTEVRLRCCYEADTANYTAIYGLLAKRFAVSEDQESSVAPIIRTCFVEAASAMLGFIFSTVERDSGRRAFSVSTTEYDLGRLHEDWDCNIPLKVDIVLQTSSPRDREEFVGNVCRRMPLTNLESAHFNFDVETILSSNFWWETFGYLEGLRCIGLAEVKLGGFVRVLESDSRVFAPHLEELELYSASFLKEGRRRTESVRSWDVVMAHLYDALAGRQAAGRGFKRLIFADRMYVADHAEGGLKEVTTTNPQKQRDEGGAADKKGPRFLFE